MHTYPIHRCIFRNDSYGLVNLLKDDDIKKRINEVDNHGNTPLNLALMLDRRNCILILINYGCDCITNNKFGWSPLEESISLGDVDILEKLIIMKWKQEAKKWIAPGGKMEEWNEKLPNAYLKFRVKLSSQIPIISKICPKDTIELIKKGSNIRINFGFNGLDRRNIPKLIKGKMSLYIKYDQTKELPQILLVDHNKKEYQELFPNIPTWSINDMVDKNYRANSVYRFLFDISNGIIKKKNKGKIFAKKTKALPLEKGRSVKVDLYKVKDVSINIRQRNHECLIGDRKSEIKTNIMNIQMNRKRSGSKSKPPALQVFSDLEKTFTELNTLTEDDGVKSGDKAAIKGGKLTKKDSKANSAEIDDDDDDDEEEDSDEDSEDDISTIYTESVEADVSRDGSTKSSMNSDNDSSFYEFISSIPQDKPMDKEMKKKITKMIIEGVDENGEKISKENMEYLNKCLPSFFENIIEEATSQSCEVTRTNPSMADTKDVSIHRQAPTDANGHNNVNDTTVAINTFGKAEVSKVVSKDGRTITYDIKVNENELDDDLNWDQAYMARHKDSATAAIASLMGHNVDLDLKNYEGDIPKDIFNDKKYLETKIDWTKSGISEEEYFNEENKEALHLGRYMRIEEERRKYSHSMKVYMSKEGAFPITFNQIQPLIDFIFSSLADNISITGNDANDQEYYEKAMKRISKKVNGDNCFPIKFVIPIIATVKAKLKVVDCHINGKELSDDLFEIPNDYVNKDVYFKIIY